ncbi:DnaD domain-containing protein [Staphylococcus pseudintermedius]|uniref:DnaD domain-containing protein n=1 Tax=Staphylococcus pseudintermedius TaxID=283734 RepID=UPI001BDECA23|nr:DnaD domain protein [Staphylococcus pseudintermedius]EIM5198710.1 DnaD domain protein [Staphylococcus pseudintermedius]EJM2461513.1 DnaD domain protein [Staphylococcus pseudintermedius]
MTGWISLHRSIENHWLYPKDRPFSELEAWLYLLLTVNHKDNKTLFDGKIIVVKRGSTYTSLRKLSERWNWSTTKVTRFLNLLEQDNMVTQKKDSRKTVITVVNYDIYQNMNIEKRQQNNTEITPKKQKDNTEVTPKKTNNNDNNVNKENKKNKDNKRQSVFSFYQENGFGVLRPYIADQISGWLDDFKNDGEEIVIAAMQEALKNNKVSWNYTNAILKNWYQKGYRSITDIEASMKQRQHQSTDNETTKRQQQYVEALENNFRLPENLDDLPF